MATEMRTAFSWAYRSQVRPETSNAGGFFFGQKSTQLRSGHNPPVRHQDSMTIQSWWQPVSRPSWVEHETQLRSMAEGPCYSVTHRTEFGAQNSRFLSHQPACSTRTMPRKNGSNGVHDGSQAMNSSPLQYTTSPAMFFNEVMSRWHKLQCFKGEDKSRCFPGFLIDIYF